MVGSVSRMIISPADKNLMIFLGSHGVNWMTQDCAENIYAMNQGIYIDIILKSGRKINEF
jgi:hypothetical protein